MRLGGDGRAARRTRYPPGIALRRFGRALRHRRRQFHPGLPVRFDRRPSGNRTPDQFDCRRRREWALRRAQLGGYRCLKRWRQNPHLRRDGLAMNKVSLVVSDVDGTLVTGSKVLIPRVVAAVERLHARGIGVSICSSRPPFGLRMLIEPLRLALPFGGYNGGTIVTPDFSVVEQKLVPPEAARTAVEMFRAYAIDCWLFVGNEWVILNPEGSHVAHETRTVQTPPTVVPRFTEAHLAGAGKIVGPNDDYDLISRKIGERARRPRQCGALSALLLRCGPAGHRQGTPDRPAVGEARCSAPGDPRPRRHGERSRNVWRRRVFGCDGQCRRGGQASRQRRDPVQ